MWGFLGLMLGVLLGLSIYTFGYARGASYLSDDPRACVNCDVMRDQYDGWSRSSHKAVATCNGCHTPNGFLSKWMVKGINGWNHSLAFTTGNFPDPIRVRAFNAEIAQANCVTCHAVLVSQIHRADGRQARFCIECHGNVGHAD